MQLCSGFQLSPAARHRSRPSSVPLGTQVPGTSKGTQVPIIGTKFCTFLKNNRYSSAIIVQNCVTTYYYNSMSCGKSEQQHLRAQRRRELSKNSILVTFNHIFSTAMYPIITFSTICYIAQIGRQPASTILISARSSSIDSLPLNHFIISHQLRRTTCGLIRYL